MTKQYFRDDLKMIITEMFTITFDVKKWVRFTFSGSF